MGQPAPHSARYGGFYSVLARPGFRIISINTNYCYRLNWCVAAVVVVVREGR